MAEGVFTKHYNALRPDDEMAAAIMQTIKAGEAVKIKVTRSRSLPHLRLYWKLMQIVWENQDTFPTKEKMERAFRLAVGHYEMDLDVEGREYPTPLPINFNKMDQAEFNIFFNKAVNFLCTEIIPGMDSEDLRRETYELLGEGQ